MSYEQWQQRLAVVERDLEWSMTSSRPSAFLDVSALQGYVQWIKSKMRRAEKRAPSKEQA